jgi:small subunit ribosomal protein S6
MVLSPEATEEEVASTVERVDGMIAAGGGSVSEHDNWGVRRLAYPIRNFAEGNYVLTRFAVNAGAVIEISRTLKASEDILRYLVTKR